MTQACTIFCPRIDYEVVETTVRRFARDCVVAVTDTGTRTIVIRVPAGSLRFTTLEKSEPMSNFAKLILGMVSWVGRSSLDAKSGHAIQSFVASCRLAIGVVAEPSMDSDARFRECIFDVAKHMSGIIFDEGVRLIDANGLVILDHAGNSEVTVALPDGSSGGPPSS